MHYPGYTVGQAAEMLGTTADAACRTITLEDQLHEAQQHHHQLNPEVHHRNPAGGTPRTLSSAG
jgi:hypothetical protein